jgi:hypothetical protein
LSTIDPSRALDNSLLLLPLGLFHQIRCTASWPIGWTARLSLHSGWITPSPAPR